MFFRCSRRHPLPVRTEDLDDIVQALAVAKYALETHDEGAAAAPVVPGSASAPASAASVSTGRTSGGIGFGLVLGRLDSTGSWVRITPRPPHSLHVSLKASSRPWPTRLRVICTRPREVTS